MPVPSSITDLSTTAASNSPAGSDNVFPDLDNYLRAYASFVALLRDGKGLSTEVSLASAGTCDVGGAASMFVQITGTTTITSFGTNYLPRILRFAGVLTLTHNATTLILPTGANITTAAGDTCLIVPVGTSGWRVLQYQRASDGSSLFLQAGTSAVNRTVQGKLRDVVSVKDFGAVGDGVTDDFVAFTNALAASAGKKLCIPAGTYRFPFIDTHALTPPANCVIEGDGMGCTTLVFVPSSTTDRNCFLNSAGNLTLRNLRITVEVPTNGSISLVAHTASHTLIEGCELDGACTNSGATISHTAYGIKFPSSGTVTDINVISCNIRRVNFGTLKSNLSTCINRRISFSHCDFFGNYNEDLSFNSPAVGSVMDDVQVYMCRFRDGSGVSAGTNHLLCSFASITNFRVGGCSFSGDVGDAIHIEENCNGGSITGNVMEVNPGNNGAAIWISDNGESGTDYIPQNISVTGNVMRKAGTQKEAGRYGFWLVNNATPEVAAKRMTIVGNVASGFFSGFSVRGVTLDDGCDVSGNLADNCTNGFAVEYGSLSVKGNTSTRCDVGLQLTNGGAIAEHTFIDCTVNADAVTIPALLVNPSWVFTEFANAGGGSTNVALHALGANDRAHGFLDIHSSCELSSPYVVRRDEVTWDGTTFTRTNKVDVSPGGMDCDSVRNSSNLCVAVFTSVTRNTIRLNVRLSGHLAVAV